MACVNWITHSCDVASEPIGCANVGIRVLCYFFNLFADAKWRLYVHVVSISHEVGPLS